MKYIFLKNNLILLESLSFTKALYAFDFDGTLAKIVTSQSEAKMSKKTAELLNELSQLATVAIISGRSLRDLKQRVKVRADFLVGSHGLEGLYNKNPLLKKAKKVCEGWMISLAKGDFPNGIEIEEKVYSITIHYRKCRNKTLARESIKTALQNLQPTPKIVSGKAVVNLLPKNSPHKGAAILDIMDKLGTKHGLYIGDDDTDEDVFALPYSDGQLLKIRVGKKRASKATYFIERQSEINRLLKYLINFHKANTVK